MSTRVRVLAFGVLGGVLLSVMRAPLGLDLLRAAAVDGPTRAAIRAAGLFALAVAIWNARVFARSVAVIELSAAVLVGYAVHGLFLTSLAPLGTRFELALALVVISLLMHFVARSDPDPSPSEAPSPPGTPGSLELLGLALAGAGVALALESVARRVRLLGLGLPADDTVFGTTFLVAVMFGGAAFGRLLPIARRGPALLTGGLALAAAGAAIGSARLVSYESAEVLGGFLRSVGSLFTEDPSSPLRIDVSHLGTWQADAVLGASCLVVPALLVGAALCGARHRRRLAGVVAGAAIGTLAVPFVLRSLERSYDLQALETSELQSALLGSAMRVAAAGAILGALAGTRGLARIATVVVAAVPIATSAALRLEDAWLFSPWDSAPRVYPRVVLDTADGLLTVEPVRGTLVATLNRHRLTPTGWEEQGDADRIERSLALVQHIDEPRVLLVGQMTPARVATFARIAGSDAHVDRTAPWFRAVSALEQTLFQNERSPEGELVTLSEAKKRIDAGTYDLVLVPPSFGPRLPTLPAQFDSAPSDAPRSQGWQVPDGTVAVVWVDASAELSATDLGEHVLLTPVPFDEPTVGLVVGRVPAGADVLPGAPRELGPAPGTRLRWRAYQRQHDARARLFARLSRAAVGTPAEDLVAAIGTHFAAQRESSPFLTEAAQIEVDESSLEHMRRWALATPAVPSGSLGRSVCEAFAQILDGRREPGYVLEYVAPIAEAHGPWYVLDLAVVGAYIEFDMDTEVEPRLAALVERDPYNLHVLLRCADWERDHERERGEAEYLRRMLEVQPGRSDALARLAPIAVRLGEPDAEELLRRAVDADPDDSELREMLESLTRDGS
jgi:hypothetical protein